MVGPELVAVPDATAADFELAAELLQQQQDAGQQLDEATALLRSSMRAWNRNAAADAADDMAAIRSVEDLAFHLDAEEEADNGASDQVGVDGSAADLI